MKRNRFMHSDPNRRALGKQRRQLPRAEMSTHKECKYCGKDHKWGKQHCAGYKKLCKKCNKQNHFAQMCRSSAKSGTKQAAVHMMRYDSETACMKTAVMINAGANSK